MFASGNSPERACNHLLLNIQSTGTVMTLSFGADRSGQTVQTQIRLLLLSDQGFQCLLFHLHHFDKIP